MHTIIHFECAMYRIHSPVEHIQSMCWKCICIEEQRATWISCVWDQYHSGQWKATKINERIIFSFESFCEPKSQKLVNCTNHLADFPHTNNHFPYSTHILLVHTQTPYRTMIHVYVEECSYIQFILYKLFHFLFLFFYLFISSFFRFCIAIFREWLAGWLYCIGHTNRHNTYMCLSVMWCVLFFVLFSVYRCKQRVHMRDFNIYTQRRKTVRNINRYNHDVNAKEQQQ